MDHLLCQFNSGKRDILGSSPLTFPVVGVSLQLQYPSNGMVHIVEVNI